MNLLLFLIPLMFLINQDNSILPFPLIVLFILSVVLSLACIFLYKKRKIQLRLNQVNYLIILGSICMIFWGLHVLGDFTKGSEIRYGISFFLPLAALVFNFLANRGVKNDEKLISSLDRLR